MLNIRNTIWIFLFLVTFVVIPFSVHAETPQELLNQYISDLQKNPNDNALREKIIRHVQEMKPAPLVPEEAKKYMARGKAAFKVAKEAKDFNDAAEEFKKSVLYAPWLAEGYYNLGIVQDKAGQYAEAIKSLKLYVLAAPNAPDVEKVKELIYEIEYCQEKAAKESSPEAIAAKEKNKYDEWLKKLNGVRYVYPWNEGNVIRYLTIDIRGNKVIEGLSCIRGCDNPSPGEWKQFGEVTLNGREFTITDEGCLVSGNVVKRVFRGKISEDGYSLTREDCNGTNTYRRER